MTPKEKELKDKVRRRNQQIRTMTTAFENILNTLGPLAPKCSGCEVEVNQAIQYAKRALKTDGSGERK
jgi:hypothetical protein